MIEQADATSRKETADEKAEENLQYTENLKDAFSRPSKETENENKHGGIIKKGKKDEMAIIIAIGRPKANKKVKSKAPIRVKRGK